MVTKNDIREAFENDSNITSKLKGYHFARHPRGTIKAETGGFCITVPFQKNGEATFSKCLRIWWKNLDNMKEHSSIVSSAIRSSGLDYFLDYEYLDSALYINGNPEPGILMNWIDKPIVTMSEFLLYGNPSQSQLQALADNFYQMAANLNKKNFAHGDLSSSNILVNPHNMGLILIDYDSMYVPSMGNEYQRQILGTDGYKHPEQSLEKRKIEWLRKSSNCNIDHFAQLVIYVQLLAMSMHVELCKDIDEKGHLLFTQSELDNQEHFRSSKYYQLISSMDNPDIKFYLKKLEQAIAQPFDEVSFICDLTPPSAYKPESPMPKIEDPNETEQQKPIDREFRPESPMPEPAPQDILGEYCAYCQYKIADYCKTHEEVDSTVKFCPNCGKPRITYRLDKQNI